MTTIAEIHDEILRCKKCPLSEFTTPVPGTGNPHSSLLMLGMEPGDQEEYEGRPFIGPSGKYLAQALKMHGRSLDFDFYRTNVVRCRPRDGHQGKPSTKRNANWSEVAACASWTEAEIRAVDPDIIVIMGWTAIPLAFPGLEPGQVNGLIRAVWLFGRVRLCVGAYHPAGVLRQRGLAQAFSKAIRTALDLEEVANANRG